MDKLKKKSIHFLVMTFNYMTKDQWHKGIEEKRKYIAWCNRPLGERMTALERWNDRCADKRVDRTGEPLVWQTKCLSDEEMLNDKIKMNSL